MNQYFFTSDNSIYHFTHYNVHISNPNIYIMFFNKYSIYSYSRRSGDRYSTMFSSHEFIVDLSQIEYDKRVDHLNNSYVSYILQIMNMAKNNNSTALPHDEYLGVFSNSPSECNYQHDFGILYTTRKDIEKTYTSLSEIYVYFLNMFDTQPSKLSFFVNSGYTNKSNEVSEFYNNQSFAQEIALSLLL